MEIHLNGKLRIFLFALFGILMSCISYLTYYFDPKEVIAEKAIKLSRGSLVFNIWENPPYNIYVKCYIFTVTNSEAFLNGDDKKLKLLENGPYTYKETLHNTESVFHENGTLSFVPRRTLQFIPELSVGDPNDYRIIVPNAPLLAITSMLHKSSMFTNLALSSLVRVMDIQPFLNITVYEYLWGYEDKLIEGVHNLWPNWIPFTKFGILDRMYDEGNNTVSIVVEEGKFTGNPVLEEQERGRMYSITNWNGSPGLAHWGYEEPEDNETISTNTKCNLLEGSFEGTIFPPNISKQDVFRVYRRTFCRTVPFEYMSNMTTDDGILGYYFTLSKNFLDRMEDNPDNSCYCKEPEYCLPRGLGDITPCYYGFPIAVSCPHFLETDPIVFERLEGLSPNFDNHGTKVLLNPRVGLVMEGYSRIQINLIMRNTKYISRITPFNDMVIPLFWNEMVVDSLPPKLRFYMILLEKVLPIGQTVFIYLMALGGASMIAYAGLLVLFTPTPMMRQQRSPSLGIGYTAIRMIPAIRRESLLTDIREKNR